MNYALFIMDEKTIMIIRKKFHAIRSALDEKARRRWAASEAMAIGWGGMTTVSIATGISRPTIQKGIGCGSFGTTPAHAAFRKGASA